MSSTLLEKKDFSKLPATSSFVPPRRNENPETDQLNSLLGPGYYDPKITGTIGVSNNNKKSSVFKSTSKRGFQPPKEGPAPGDYEGHVPKFLKQSDLLPSAAMRSSSLRTNLNAGGAASNPGPGDYNWDVSFQKLTKHSLDHQTSVFSNTNTDRFGNQYQPKLVKEAVPGPGSYYSDKKLQPSTVTSSVFLSNSKRGDTKVVRPPGPAYYNPKNVDSKSFLLNAKGKWV
jgi:hypothetical protein